MQQITSEDRLGSYHYVKEGRDRWKGEMLQRQWAWWYRPGTHTQRQRDGGATFMQVVLVPHRPCLTVTGLPTRPHPRNCLRSIHRGLDYPTTYNTIFPLSFKPDKWITRGRHPDDWGCCLQIKLPGDMWRQKSSMRLRKKQRVPMPHATARPVQQAGKKGQRISGISWLGKS